MAGVLCFLWAFLGEWMDGWMNHKQEKALDISFVVGRIPILILCDVIYQYMGDSNFERLE